MTYKKYLAWLAAAVFVPVILLKMSAPFQFFDFMGSVPDEYFQKPMDVLGFTELPHNLWANLVVFDLHFRPTSFLIYNLEYVFLRLPYLQFAFKFILIIAVPFLAANWVYLLTKNNWAAFLAGAITVIHPAPASLMLASSESYAGFLIMFLLLWSDTRTFFLPGDAAEIPSFWDKDIVRDAVFCIASLLLLGLKENTFAIVIALAAYYCIRNRPYSRPASMWTCIGVLAAAVALVILRLYQIRFEHPDLDYTKTPLQFLNDFRKGLRDAFIYLSPIEAHVRASIIMAAAFGFSILGGTGGILSDRTKKVSPQLKTATVVALAIILATVVLSSIPAHYPPSVTPRYIVPAVPVLAALAGFIFATLRKFPAFVFAALISLFIFVSPATMFEREVTWAKYNETFSAILNRAIVLEDEGYMLYVSNVPGTEHTMQNFFSPLGRKLFHHSYPDIKDLSNLDVSVTRFAVVSNFDPYVFKDHFSPPAPFVLTNISAASDDAYSSSGSDRLLNALQFIPSVLRISGRPYHEAGLDDIAAEGRPSLFLYSYCRSDDEACTPLKVQTLYDACAVLRSAQGVTSEYSADHSILHFQTQKPLDVDLPLTEIKGRGAYLVQLEGMSVEHHGFLRIQMGDWQGWSHFPDLQLSPKWLGTPILTASSKVGAVKLFAYEPNGDFSVTCPFNLHGYPVTPVKWQRQWGAFQP